MASRAAAWVGAAAQSGGYTGPTLAAARRGGGIPSGRGGGTRGMAAARECPAVATAVVTASRPGACLRGWPGRAGGILAPHRAPVEPPIGCTSGRRVCGAHAGGRAWRCASKIGRSPCRLLLFLHGLGQFAVGHCGTAHGVEAKRIREGRTEAPLLLLSGWGGGGRRRRARGGGGGPPVARAAARRRHRADAAGRGATPPPAPPRLPPPPFGRAGGGGGRACARSAAQRTKGGEGAGAGWTGAAKPPRRPIALQ